MLKVGISSLYNTKMRSSPAHSRKKKLELAYACLTEMETCFLDLRLGTEVSVWKVELTSNGHRVLLLADFVDCSPISKATLSSHLSLFFSEL